MTEWNATIVALATPPGIGALGIIRLSGPEAIGITDRIFKGKKLADQPTHTLHFGQITDPQSNDVLIDEVVVSLYRNPRSFTGEDTVEITCHGSSYILGQLMDVFIHQGAVPAKPGEFTQRAFLNGRMDLAQAEAVADLIASENKASHQMALSQMRGSVSTELAQLRDQLISFTALIELELDFSDEDVEFADRPELEQLIDHLQLQVGKLIETFAYGNAIKNGVPVAIIGKPNAGKSTLLNALLQEDRAIVSDIAGTTRDAIEEAVNIEGISFRFIDTAGIRATTDTIEAIGIARAKEKLAQAQVVIHLYEQDHNLLEELADTLKDKIVFNLVSKADVNVWPNDKYEQYLTEIYPQYQHFGISVKTGFNMDLLKRKLVAAFRGDDALQPVIITNARHKKALEQAMNALREVKAGMQSGLSGDLLSIHLKEALHHLGSITGKIDVDKDILGTIFGKFCIGK
jgi:tRNA modification GTPase